MHEGPQGLEVTTNQPAAPPQIQPHTEQELGGSAEKETQKCDSGQDCTHALIALKQPS